MLGSVVSERFAKECGKLHGIECFPVDFACNCLRPRWDSLTEPEPFALFHLLNGDSARSLLSHLVHREGRYASQKARAFLDLAIERLRAHPALN